MNKKNYDWKSEFFRRLVRTSVVLAMPVLAGCVGVWRTPYDPSAESSTANSLPVVPAAFDYEQGVQPIVTPLPTADSNYDKFFVNFPDVERNGSPAVNASAYFYRSKLGGAARKTIIILPIWGSYSYPQSKVSRTLRRRSNGEFHIIEVIGDQPLFFWDKMRNAPTEQEFVTLAGQMTGRVEDMVVAIRQLVDWAEDETEVEVSLIGFSMGAIVGAIALGVDDRLSNGVLMMGGGHPGRIFATCNGKVGRIRASAERRFGWTQDQYQALFDGLFAAGDPARYAGRYDPGRLLLFDGAFDGCMSRDARYALWNATGRPERIRFLGTHRWAFMALTPFALNMAGKKIYDFMSEDFPAEPTQLACASGTAC